MPVGYEYIKHISEIFYLPFEIYLHTGFILAVTNISKMNSNSTSSIYKIYSKITFNPLRANPTKWSNTLKQFVGNLPTNCLSVFNHFVGLAFKVLRLVPLILSWNNVVDSNSFRSAINQNVFCAAL